MHNGIPTFFVRYTRQPCIYGDKMIAIQLEIVNNGDKPITNVHMEAKVIYILKK